MTMPDTRATDGWAYAAAGLAGVSGLLFTAAPAQFGGVVAICQQAAARLLTLPDDFTQQAILAFLFFMATAAQWMIAVMLLVNRARLGRSLLRAALAWTLGVLGLWVVIRLAGGLWPGFTAEPVNVVEFLARTVDVALAACLVVLGQAAASDASSPPG